MDQHTPGLGAIVSMQLQVAQLWHPPAAIDALRAQIKDRAEALGLEAVEVSLTKSDGDLIAVASFDLNDDAGQPLQATFTAPLEVA